MLYDPKIDKRNQRLATVLDIMAERIGKNEHAWCQDSFLKYVKGNDDFAVCLVEAVSQSTDKGERREPFYNALARELPTRMAGLLSHKSMSARDKLIFFNDYKSTDLPQVLDLIARARAKVPVPCD
jgi:hypothetical protein